MLKVEFRLLLSGLSLEVARLTGLMTWVVGLGGLILGVRILRFRV